MYQTSMYPVHFFDDAKGESRPCVHYREERARRDGRRAVGDARSTDRAMTHEGRSRRRSGKSDETARTSQK